MELCYLIHSLKYAITLYKQVKDMILSFKELVNMFL